MIKEGEKKREREWDSRDENEEKKEAKENKKPAERYR